MKHEALDQFVPFPGISEFVYSARDFAAVRELVYESSANVLPPNKSTLVYSRLAPLVRNSGLGTFSAYIERLKTDNAERHKAVCALTTNHTAFFREDHHFDHFLSEVRPQMIRKLGAGQPVRLWSAGSSSGEEVFSLCMTLLGPDKVEARRLLAQDLAVLATDLADHVLVKAKRATYDADALAPVPPALRSQWVREDGQGGGTVVDPIRELVRFKALNLMGKWPMKKAFDVIFCRNVMIYFDQPTKDNLVARFADQLVPGGHLYIGHSERVSGPAAAQLELVGKTIYRKIR
ncbi:MAG TPA: protein-glutamate O-methyltransferase CheR [Sphingobium sp.]|uniref:CheR family methyltransferase n=1 Tax=Sphingobium sp. TaxID=1912891 RepID=UPI002ED09AC9